MRWLHLQAPGKKETPPNILGMRHDEAESPVVLPEDLLTDADLEKPLAVLDAKRRCVLLLLRCPPCSWLPFAVDVQAS